eukprot:gene11836-11980_t
MHFIFLSAARFLLSPAISRYVWQVERSYDEVAAAQQLDLNGRGIRICVIDNAFDITHPTFGGCQQPGDPRPCRVYYGKDLASQFVSLSPTAQQQKSAAANSTAGLSILNTLEPFRKSPLDGRDDVNPKTLMATHGTHVAGIALGSFPNKLLDANGDPLPYQQGVAPAALLGAFKAGLDDGTMDAAAVLSSLRAAATAACDVVSMSFGGWNGEPADGNVASFVQPIAALIKKDMVPVASAGNAEQGAILFTVTHPAALPNVLAVAALNNTVNPGQLLQLDRNITTQSGDRDMLIGIQRADTGRALSSIQLPAQLVLMRSSSLDEGCLPLRRITSTDSLSGKVLVLQFRNDCNKFAFRDDASQWATIREADPALVLFALPNDIVATYAGVAFNNGDIPIIWLAAEDAAAVINVLTEDFDAVLNLVALPGAIEQPLPAEIARLPALSSSSGPTFDLQIKPDIAAPGTLYSSVPNNSYETYAGTSMAAPYIAGVLALWKQRHTLLWAGTKRKPMRSWNTAATTSMRTTAAPIIIPQSTLAYPPLKVGAGRVQALSMVVNEVYLSPSQLLMRTDRTVQTFSLSISNTGTKAITYSASHLPAASVALHKSWYNQPYDMDAPVARTAITPSSFTVQAGGTARVTVTITVHSAMRSLDLLFSGYIRFTPTTTAIPDNSSILSPPPPIILSVTYLGSSRPYSSYGSRSLALFAKPRPAIDALASSKLQASGPAYLCSNWSQGSLCEYQTGQVTSYTEGDLVGIGLALVRPVRQFAIQVFDGTGGRLLGTTRNITTFIPAPPPLKVSLVETSTGLPWDGSFGDANTGNLVYLTGGQSYTFQLLLYPPLAAADLAANSTAVPGPPLTVRVSGVMAMRRARRG